jgi:hypothetical protein
LSLAGDAFIPGRENLPSRHFYNNTASILDRQASAFSLSGAPFVKSALKI